jgi:hypothetical protein
MVWVDVPDNSVITEPNKAERTMVWPVHFEDETADEDPYIRCFMPGSMTQSSARNIRSAREAVG